MRRDLLRRWFVERLARIPDTGCAFLLPTPQNLSGAVVQSCPDLLYNPAMSEAAFIAGDWGTSRLRLYLCDPAGNVLARGEGEGASVPDCAGRFAAATVAWDKAHGLLPAVLSG